MSSLYYLNESTVQLMYYVKTNIIEDYYVEERPQSHMPEAADKGLAQKMPPGSSRVFAAYETWVNT